MSSKPPGRGSHCPQSGRPSWEQTGTAEGAAGQAPHLLVPAHFGLQGGRVEEPLQPLLPIVVAELLKGGRPLSLLVPGAEEAGGIHHHQGGCGEVAGGEGPAREEDRFPSHPRPGCHTGQPLDGAASPAWAFAAPWSKASPSQGEAVWGGVCLFFPARL